MSQPLIAFVWQRDRDALGRALAQQLLDAGHEVAVFVRGALSNVSSGAPVPGAARLGVAARTGATPRPAAAPLAAASSAKLREAPTLASAVKGAEVVLTLLSSPQEAEDVYLGEGGVFEKAHDAELFIDLGTSSPRLAKELYALAAVHDHCFVEAPLEISFKEPPDGGLAAPVLRAFAAGEPDSLKRALPLLGLLAPEVVDAGLPGCGVACKLASQIAVAGALMGVVESVTFALLAGVDPVRIPQILEHGAAASAVARAFGRRILDEEFYHGGDLRLFFNELTSALDVADTLELALPGLETAHQLYDLLVLIGGGKKGIHALALIYYDEKRCVAHGLDWELAQRAMDVYERANENCSGCAYGDDYDYDYDDEEDCDEDACGHSHRPRSSPHRPDDDDIPLMGGYFSSN